MAFPFLRCALLLGVFTITAGCGVDVGGLDKPVERVSSAMEKSATEVKNGAAQLAQGLRDIDPMDLKDLIKKNETLRQQLDEIAHRTQTLPEGYGVVDLENTTVSLRVTALRGSFKIVRGYVDEESQKNSFWTPGPVIGPSTYSLGGLHLGLARDTFINYGVFAGGPNANPTYVQVLDVANNVDVEYKKKYDDFLDHLGQRIASNPQRFGAAQESISLHRHFLGSSGNRKVTIVAEPRGDGPHQIRVEVVSQQSGGPEEQIDRVDSDDSDFVSGKPKELTCTVPVNLRPIPKANSGTTNPPVATN